MRYGLVRYSEEQMRPFNYWDDPIKTVESNVTVYEDADGIGYASMIDFIQQKLGFCGCGDGLEVMEMLRDVLSAFEAQDQEACRKATGGGPAETVVLYVLDTNDLTEHSGIVHFSTLTEAGKKVLKWLRTELPESPIQGAAR